MFALDMADFQATKQLHRIATQSIVNHQKTNQPTVTSPPTLVSLFPSE